MIFLQTRSGLIAGKHIVRIGSINTRTPPIESWHEVDYVHGGEARTTQASPEDIEDFLMEQS